MTSPAVIRLAERNMRARVRTAQVAGTSCSGAPAALTERAAVARHTRPHIVCLCGSTRFSEAFREANLRETLAGNIVLTIGCDMRSDAGLFAGASPGERARIKADLDTLHRHKIKLADSVLVLNVGGYIGDSTRAEIAYARQIGKPIRYLHNLPPAA